jgi:two-component system, NarL family, nitrate/nitrite response regulator NarL
MRITSHDLMDHGVAWGTPPAVVHLAPPSITPISHESDDVPSAAPPEILRVLVVAEDPLARAGLAAMLAELPDCRLVGQVAPDAELGPALERLDPDAVVWDAGRTAPPDLADLGEGAPPVLMLSPEGPQAFRRAAGGVRGLLPRDVDAPTLMAALRAVAKGLLVADPAFAKGASPSSDQAAVTLSEALTPREVEVLQLLASGLPNKIIAGRLGISEHTVRFHLNAIFGKLDAHSRTEAVTRAARLGVIVL